MNRLLCLATLVVVVLAVPLRSVGAQLRLSAGVGGGIAGSTESSLSDGTAGVVLMGQVTKSLVPLFGIGVDVNDWRGGGSNIAFVTANAQLHIPVTPFYVKLGGGVGTGDPDGRGTISGAAIQIGAAYDITLPLAPVALTLFGNALLAHASERSLQMVDAGLAFTWR
jgi:hypothetical protein